MITFKCPICDEVMEAPEALRGKTLQCPNCGETVGVHGINKQLTPKSDTLHTDHPIYETRNNWFLATFITCIVIVAVTISLAGGSWEKNHQQKIQNLSAESIKLISNNQYNEGMQKYLELQQLIDNKTIKDKANLDAINRAKIQFQKASEFSRNNHIENDGGSANANQSYTLTLASLNELAQEVVGQWSAPTDLNNGEIAIAIFNDSYFFLRFQNGALDFANEIIEFQSVLPGRFFEDQAYLDWGIYYRINPDGNLEFWDRGGYISTAIATEFSANIL